MSEYLLGHGQTEWSRLAEQHALWQDSLLAGLPLRAGQSVLEVGCGSGALLADLAERVGPTGRCAGLERDPDAVVVARGVAEERRWVSLIEGDLRTADLGGPWDVIVARWVLSFLPDPGACIERLAGALAEGGVLVVQDYNHDGVRIFPDVPAFNRTIAAYRAAYARQGGDLWIAGSLPGMMAAAGLEVVGISPEVKAGQPGSPVWRWVERFIFEHLDSISAEVAAPDYLSPVERQALVTQWRAAAGSPDAVLFSPMQVTVTGRSRGSRS